MREQQGALTHVIECQTRQHDADPRELDRLAAEMAEIRVQGFGTGQRQHDRTHRREHFPAARDEEVPGMQRIERRENLRLLDDVANRSEEDTSELQSLMRISYAVFCLQ